MPGFMNPFLRIAAVVSLAFGLSQHAQADFPDGWAWRSPVPLGSNLNDVLHNGSLWITVGDKGNLATSVNGRDWTSRWTGLSGRLNGVAYGNNLYVVVGESGRVLYSGDGVQWSQASVGSTDELQRVVFGGGVFVALPAYTGSPYYLSSNGSEWTPVTGQLNMGRYDARYCNGKFYMAGGDTWGVIASSTDAKQWTSTYTGADSWLTGFSCTGSSLVGSMRLGSVASSDGGKTWRASTNGPNLNHLSFGAGVYVGATETGEVFTSSDGFGWVSVGKPTDGALKRLAFGAGGFVAVGANGRIAVSDAGSSWQMAGLGGGRRYLQHAAYGNGHFVVAGSGVNAAQGNANTLLSSADGQTWTARKDGIFYGLRFVNDRFFAVGHYGAILSSTDGQTWTDLSLPGAGSLYGVAYGNCRYVITGGNNSGVVLVSYDGVHWQTHTVAPQGVSPLGLYQVTFGNGVFLAVGNGWNGSQWLPLVFASVDGVNWEQRASPDSFTLPYITYGNGLFLAAGNGIHASSDGKQWSRVSSAAAQNIVYSHGMFFAAGYNGSVYTSNDGLSWQEKVTPAANLNGVAFGNGVLVTTGESDTILQAAPVAQCTTTDTALTLTAAGGAASLSVLAPTTCAWRAQIPSSWLTLNTPVEGVGNGNLAMAASGNSCTGPRHTEVWIDGRNVVVRQAASDVDRVLSWAENLLPALLPPGTQLSQDLSGFRLRFYPNTNKALGFLGNDVYYYDGVTVQPLGLSLPQLLDQARQVGY